MKKINKKTMLITSIITLTPMIIGILLWNQLPDRVATHFDSNWVANGWSNKGFAVFGLPLIMLVLHWMCVGATFADPKYSNISQKLYNIVLWLIPAISILLIAAVYGYALGYTINFSYILMPAIGILLMIIGNYLPKCRQNYTMGIKVPWTLADEENWNHTHHMAGYLWIGGGFLIVIAGVFRWDWVMLPVMLMVALVPMIYSYLYYRKHGVREENED